MKCSLDLVTFLYVDIWGIHLLKRFIIKHRLEKIYKKAEHFSSVFFYVLDGSLVSSKFREFLGLLSVKKSKMW